jgi:hypothetical protein
MFKSFHWIKRWISRSDKELLHLVYGKDWVEVKICPTIFEEVKRQIEKEYVLIKKDEFFTYTLKIEHNDKKFFERKNK